MERELRFKLAYVEPVQGLPGGESDAGPVSRRSLSYGAGVVDLRAIRASGSPSNIMVAKGKVSFYRRPWGAPLLVASRNHTCTIESNTFIHHSTQLHASGGSIHIGQDCIISWRIAMLTQMVNFEDGDVVVEDQCWISANSILLPGTARPHL